MKRPAYPSDLSGQLLEPLLPPPKPGGRPITYPRREIVRHPLRAPHWMLPHDLPQWRTVFHYFRTWRRDGTWQRAHDTLHAMVRQAQGRQASPSAAIIDIQHHRPPIGEDQ